MEMLCTKTKANIMSMMLMKNTAQSNDINEPTTQAAISLSSDKNFTALNTRRTL